MADINNVTLVGRLSRDAEYRSTSSGTSVCNVNIAVNRRVKKGEIWVDEASYFDVQIWGKMGESLKPYLLKGRQIAVNGELRQERWEKDGVKNSKVVIFCENVQLLAEPKGNKTNYSENGYKPANNNPPTDNLPPTEPSSPEDFMDNDDFIIPF